MDDLPQYVAVSRDEPFFMASLDAYYVKGREVFEFKNVYSQNHERFADVMKNGLIPKPRVTATGTIRCNGSLSVPMPSGLVVRSSLQPGNPGA